ncbi:MAG: ABC transporter ATP-binding protein [Timaviella obliquedivisa GSE-PSE-MK23-08B]|nr:ABC transporter ATP-binding protein [Timaviella obliquedivisa GSE-PSE-MK23-08B]
MAQVVLENVYKSFPSRQSGRVSEATAEADSVAILRRINLNVEDGEFMVLVGPSGCGKSTLLRLIAGLETLTGGNIWVGDRQVNHLPPKERDIAMVFQSYALYPHMTVYDNLAFGLRRAGRNHSTGLAQRVLAQASHTLPRRWRYETADERAIAQRVQAIAEMLQIEMLLDRLPKQLSGGQKQRVALGRAMARDPQVFLMDEPLSNLDAKLRTETRTQIVNLQRKLGTTTIYVTHDQTEAMTMGDRIAVMNAGQIQQIARPLELYNQPANRFVAEFIGSPPMNFLPVQVKAPATLQHPQFRLTLPGIWEMDLRHYVDRSLLLGIRPEHLHVSVPAPKNIPIRVERVEALGSETYLTASLIEAENDPDAPLIQVRTESDRVVSIGETLWLSVSPEKIHLFDVETGEAIASPLLGRTAH